MTAKLERREFITLLGAGIASKGDFPPSREADLKIADARLMSR
jgi:hypothetical protein